MNDSGSEILSLCDGRISIEEIIDLLSEYFDEKKEVVSNFVSAFLHKMENAKLITMDIGASSYSNRFLTCGNKDYWTPEVFALELTELCPLKCKHCYLGAGCPDGNSMTEELIDRIFDELRTMYPESIQLTGGEPLLHPKFWDILDRSLLLNAMVHIFTSGVITSPEIIRRFSKYSEQNLVFQISLDGLEKHHDKFRGVEGSFGKTIGFTKALVDLGFDVIIGTCLDNQTFDEIQKLCKLVKTIGVRSLRLGSISEQGRAETNKISYTLDKYYKLKSFQKQLSEEENTDSFKVQYIEDSHIIQSEYVHNCGFGTTILKIDPTCSVYPCLLCDIKIGDLSRETIIDTQKKWSRILERIRPPDSNTCEFCEKKQLCHDCIVEGMIYGSGISQCHWFSKETELQMLRQKCGDADA